MYLLIYVVLRTNREVWDQVVVLSQLAGNIPIGLYLKEVLDFFY